MAAPEPYERPDRLRILLELRYCLSSEEVCSKWSITPYRLRKWKREFGGFSHLGSERDWILGALYRGAQDVAALRAYLDWHNRSAYRDDEILVFLRELESTGFAVRSSERWLYRMERLTAQQPFIF